MKSLTCSAQTFVEIVGTSIALLENMMAHGLLEFTQKAYQLSSGTMLTLTGSGPPVVYFSIKY
jgi:hypothetical protein